MTLRDYFAGKAIPAVLAQPDGGISNWTTISTTWPQIWAQEAYLIADAMLAERAK